MAEQVSSYAKYLVQLVQSLADSDSALFWGQSSGGQSFGGQSPVHIHNDAQPVMLAALSHQLNQEKPVTLLVFTPTIASAEELTKELQGWLEEKTDGKTGGTSGGKSGGKSSASRVAMLPAWETLPFERVSPSIQVMGRRLAIFDELTNPKRNSLDIVVAPTRALLQKSPPLNIASLDLEVGGEYDREELLEWLVTQGYRREIQVSARGEMAIRGGIIDVFASAPIGDGHDEPLRIELFGDTIDSMRAFSLANQLATKEIQRAHLLPAREFIPTAKERARAKELSASLNWGQKHWEDLAEGIFFEGMESWMCWLRQDISVITELLTNDSANSNNEPDNGLDNDSANDSSNSNNAPNKDVQIVWLQQNQIRENAVKFKAEESELALMDSWGITEREIEQAKEITLTSNLGLTADFEETIAEGKIKGRQYFIDDFIANESGDRKNSLEVKGWGISGPEIIPHLKELLAEGYQVAISCWSLESAKRMKDSLYDEGIDIPIRDIPIVESASAQVAESAEGSAIFVAQISRGCIFPKLKLAILPEPQITKKQYISRSRTRATQVPTSAWLGQLTPGTYVVHENHGVGRYKGTAVRAIGNTEKEYLLIEYKGNDRLYLPAEQIGMLSLYGVGDSPRLNSLGGNRWAQTKGNARAEAEEIARELVELYGERNTAVGHSFSPDGAPHEDLAAKFPYLETPDQLEAIKQTALDMEKSAPMDRLIYGDVGFGKTEIAIRAAFKAITEGKQVAILVPTTLLARQHLQTFTERYIDFPIRVEMLSRLVSAAKSREIVKGLETGSVDLVIGTHKLLSDSVSFKDLGLLVVDEEQRFGVRQKEKIKGFHKNVDILTLTATPIPRTLEMSLTGIRDYSVIKTSPLERHPILTYVGMYDSLAVKEAIRRELFREGQVFFVHNRIASISAIHKELAELVPEAKIAVAHGRMNEVQLEKVVLDFTDKKYDVLLCTTIIEAGIDMPRVNTLVVDRAERLGLGQLHQLRGRVGRAGTQAYAYLFTSRHAELSPQAAERLRTIGEITALGSGFHLAMRDLEIRGAGNLLGFGQSGHITSVGYDMYCDLVSDAVKEIKGEAPEVKKEVIMDLQVEAHLPNDYVEDETLRLDAYRRLFLADILEIETIGEQWRDRFGPLPAPAQELLTVAKIRFLCRELDFESLSVVSNRSGASSLRVAPVSQSLISKLAKLEDFHTVAQYNASKNELLIKLGENITQDAYAQLNNIKEKVS